MYNFGVIVLTKARQFMPIKCKPGLILEMQALLGAIYEAKN
jgi:hypothetical protein